MQALDVSDAYANRFPGERGGPGFVIQQTVIVRSGNPLVVMATSQKVSELVAAGGGRAVCQGLPHCPGGIRQASQGGVFVILPRDQAPGVNESNQLQKIVRVVSTVQYFLE